MGRILTRGHSFPNCFPNLLVSDQDRPDLIPLWQPYFCDLGHLLTICEGAMSLLQKHMHFVRAACASA